MPDPLSSRCRTCGKEIVWLLYERTGVLAPIELEEGRDGNILADLEKGTYRLHQGLKPLGETYRMNHFVRCPQARFWRSGEAVAQAGKTSWR